MTHVASYGQARRIVGRQCGGFDRTNRAGRENSEWYYVPTNIYDGDQPRNDMGSAWFVNRRTGEAYRTGGFPWTPLASSPSGDIYAPDPDDMREVSDTES